MKRFLAIFAMIAMIVSMFSGVAFADENSQDENEKLVYIKVDNKILEYGKGFNTVTLSGKIFNSSSNALENVDATLKILKGSTEIEEVTAEDGVFSVLIQTDSADTGVANYTVVGVDVEGTYQFAIQADEDVALTTAEKDSAKETFSIVNKVELSSPETLEFNFPVSGQIVVQGVFTKEDGDKDNDVLTIAYKDNVASPIATANFHDDKAFGFLFNGSALTKVGEIGLYINGVLAIEGKVKASDLAVTVSPNTVVKALGNQDIVFDFDLADKYVNDDEMADGYTLNIVITDSEDNEVVSKAIIADKDNNGSFTNTTDQKVNYSVPCNAWNTGNYKVTITLEDSTTVIEEAELELRVNNPSSYTATGWSLEEVNVGDVVIQLPDNSNSDDSHDLNDNTGSPEFATASNVNEQVSVTKFTNNTYKYPKYIEITANGAGVENKKYANFGENAVEVGSNGELLATIATTETGTLTLTINAYFESTASGDAPEATKAYSFTKEIAVKGWNVEVTPKEVLVDTETEFTVTITDEEGNPVNNAKIMLNDENSPYVVDGTTKSIVGGVYTFEQKFTSVGDVKVEAVKGSEVQVSLTKGIEVLGEEIYTVTADKEALVNGLNEDLYVSVLDKDGDVVYPTFEAINYDAKGNKIDSKILTSGTRKDLDNDGVKEAVKLTVEPNHNQTAMVIRATTDGGKKMGEVSLTVEKPKVVMTGASTISQDYKTTLTFTVVDPRDNSILNKQFYFTADSTYLVDSFAVEDSEETAVNVSADKSDNLIENDNEEYEYKVFVDMVDWKTAEKDEKQVKVSLYMHADSSEDTELLAVPVAKATLTSDPESVIINASTNITLTLSDSDGNALEGYTVKLEENEIGKTNEEGKVTYATAATSSLALNFTATTDDNDEDTAVGEVEDSKVITRKVKATADTIAPVVSAPETVTGNTVVITIKDNVRVSKILVNGKPVDLFFAMPEVSHIVNVKPGNNEFRVQAIDGNNNYVDTTVSVTVVKASEPVKFTIGDETKYGTPVLDNDVTMVPVRFAQDLGATVEWNNTTRTVTYYLGETKISMTLGSKTAIVNGENVQVTVAPYLNQAGRTMVPLRMIAQELGFTVNWTSNSAPIVIE